MKARNLAHERIKSDRLQKQISDRNFGFFLAGVFLILCLRSFYRGQDTAWAFLLLGVLIGLISILKPIFLSFPKRAWLRLGDVLGILISPIIFGVIYFTLFSVFALVFRLFKGGEGFRFKNEKLDSYWVKRDTLKNQKESFNFQF